MFPYDHDEKKFDCPFISPEFDDISDSAKDILLKLLDINPDTRYTVDRALAHPWVTGEKASSSAMTITNLRIMVAKKKFKRAVETIRTCYRFRIVLKQKQGDTPREAASEEIEDKRNTAADKEKENEKVARIEQIAKVTGNLDAAEQLLASAIDKLDVLAKSGGDFIEEFVSVGKRLSDIHQDIRTQYLQLKVLQTDLNTSR